MSTRLKKATFWLNPASGKQKSETDTNKMRLHTQRFMLRFAPLNQIFVQSIALKGEKNGNRKLHHRNYCNHCSYRHICRSNYFSVDVNKRVG
jgi:hypothetical protein